MLCNLTGGDIGECRQRISCPPLRLDWFASAAAAVVVSCRETPVLNYVATNIASLELHTFVHDYWLEKK